jgi:hypothetical protein
MFISYTDLTTLSSTILGVFILGFADGGLAVRPCFSRDEEFSTFLPGCDSVVRRALLVARMLPAEWIAWGW